MRHDYRMSSHARPLQQFFPRRLPREWRDSGDQTWRKHSALADALIYAAALAVLVLALFCS